MRNCNVHKKAFLWDACRPPEYPLHLEGGQPDTLPLDPLQYPTPGKDLGPEIPYLLYRQTSLKILPSRNFVGGR